MSKSKVTLGRKQITLEQIQIIAITVISIALFIQRFNFYIIKMGIDPCDFALRRVESLSILNGINPVELRTHDMSEFGIQQGSMFEIGYTPWGYIYNILFTAPFLEPQQQLVYGYILYTILMILQAIIIMKILLKQKINKAYAIVQVTQIYLGLPVLISYKAGNLSLLMPMVLLIQILLLPYKKYENIQIVLMTIALIKPQIQALIYIVYFLYRPIKTIISSSIFIGIPWIIQQILVKQNPIELFLSSWGAGADNYRQGVVCGILSPYIRVGLIDRQLGMIITMAAQIVVTFIVAIQIKKKLKLIEISQDDLDVERHNLVWIYTTCQFQMILSLWWMYINPMDYAIPLTQLILMVCAYKAANIEINIVNFIQAIWLHVVTRNRCEVVEYYETGLNTLPIGIYSDNLLMICWMLWWLDTVENLLKQEKETDKANKIMSKKMLILIALMGIQFTLQLMGINLV